jgi:uncharacterized protein
LRKTQIPNSKSQKHPKQSINKKLEKLKRILRSYPGVVVAFSGGVDSSLLLLVARNILKENTIAMTARSPLYPAGEIASARKIARRLKVRHVVFDTDELHNRSFVRNSGDRCYHCKIELFGRMLRVARKYGYVVLEGSNRSDLKDYRPGMEAARKTGVISPLIDAGMTKDEIRRLAGLFGLPNWNKPSMACLASRVPYGRRIDRSVLCRIDRAEKYLGNLGLTQVRVRDHFPVARIEVLADGVNKIMRARRSIVRYFKKLGYQYVTLDLAGYRTGSMNLALGVKSPHDSIGTLA